MIHDILRNTKVVLASASPRRAELFKLLGINATIMPADIAEPITDEPPQIQAMFHANNKAIAVQNAIGNQHLIVSADTVVAIDNHVLGKPIDTKEAAQFLGLLSGRQHSVYTGLCLAFEGRSLLRYEHTYVKFASLSQTEMDTYIKTLEPMDKAGAYGIQGYGAQFIESVNGCYFNVMGFPIRLFYTMLTELMETK